MDSDDRFARLASRDTAAAALAARGRRRSVIIMILACVPAPFIVRALNDDSGYASVLPVALACFGSISYSWSKWKRRPEDTQSIAFVGLKRSQRRATYRSLWRGSRIEDPEVLTIVEAMHHHMRRGLLMMLAAALAIAMLGVVLVANSRSGGVVWYGIAIAAAVAAAVAAHQWITSRAGLVIRRSHAQP